MGDGTGAVTLKISPLVAGAYDHYAGAIDDLRVATDYVPSPSPTNFTYTVNANQLVLNWPAGQGWLLQSNSVSLTQPNSWFDVSGATTPFTNTINRAIPEVFYRLKH